MPVTLLQQLASAARRFDVTAVFGLVLAAPLLATAPANAQLTSGTTYYTFQQNSPVPDPAQPGNAALGEPEKWWIKLFVEEITGGIRFDFESNFGDPDNFANDFVFSLSKAITISSVTCTVGTSTVNTCATPPIYQYDPSGKQNFVGTKDWELKLETPPNPGSLENFLSGDNEKISFTVLATVNGEDRALEIEDFNQSGNAFSCSHMQGIAGAVNSSRVCTGSSPTPFIITTSSAPGPLPLFGAAAAFGYSRRIRSRIRSTSHQAPTF